MTVSSDTARNDYTLDGVATTYRYTFKIEAAGDLKVIRRSATTGVEAELVPHGDYTVSGAGHGDGGEVTLASPGTSGDLLSIVRDHDVTQPAQLSAQGQLDPAAIEAALDRLAMIAQQLRDGVLGAVRLPESVDPAGYDMHLPAPRALQVLGYGPDGVSLTSWPMTTFGATAASALAGFVNVKDAPFGAAGNGTTDDRGAIAAAAAAVGAAGYVYFPPGTYRVASSLAITAAVWLAPGATLRPGAGATVTLTHPPQAPRVRVFDVSQGGAVRIARGVDVFAEWFGLVPNDSSARAKAANDAAIAAAIQSIGRVPQPLSPTTGQFPAGGTVSVGYGFFYFGATIHLNTACRLRGASGSTYMPATVFWFPPGVHGLLVHYHNDTGDANYGWAGQCAVEDIAFSRTPGAADAAAWHGCEMRAPAYLSRCSFNGFQGNGINVDADVNEKPPNNANLFRVVHCRAYGNLGSGLYVNGGDANAGLVELLDASDNGGWGVWDSSFLGNTYVACHTANNKRGAYRTDDPNNRCVFVGCYSESGQPASSFLSPTLVLGGIQGAGIASSGTTLIDSVGSFPTLNTARAYTSRAPAAGVPNGGTISISVTALPPNGTALLLARCGSTGDEGLYIAGNNGSTASVVTVRASPRMRVAVSGTDIVFTNTAGSAQTMSAALLGINPE